MAAPVADELIEPIVGGLDPVPVDTTDTAQTELDRLRPLLEELGAWGGVYERWRAHPLATQRTAAVSLNDADHAVVDRLGGAEFGELMAAGARLTAVGAASEALAAAAGGVGSRLAQVWPGPDGAAAVHRWEAMRSAAADHGAAARQVGSRLGEAAVAARGELRVGVARALAGAEDFQNLRSGTGADPYDWLQEIDQVERAGDEPPRRERDRLVRIRTQLDDMTARYARVITSLRGSFDMAVSGVRAAWDQLELDLRRVDPDPYQRLVQPAPVPARVPTAPEPAAPATRPHRAPARSAAAPVAQPSPPSAPQPVDPPVEPGAIRAALDPTPVTSPAHAPGSDHAGDGGPVLGDTDGQQVERTGEVRVPQLPDGPAESSEPSPDQPGVEPAAVDTPQLPELQALLTEIVALVAAILAAFGLTTGPPASTSAPQH